MDSHSMSDRKKEIIDITWQYLLKHGLEHSYVGELCRETGVAQSSLYHYFENKDDIWISAGKYGLSKVVDALFEFTFNHTKNIDYFFFKLLDEAEKYKYEHDWVFKLPPALYLVIVCVKKQMISVFYMKDMPENWWEYLIVLTNKQKFSFILLFLTLSTMQYGMTERKRRCYLIIYTTE